MSFGLNEPATNAIQKLLPMQLTAISPPLATSWWDVLPTLEQLDKLKVIAIKAPAICLPAVDFKRNAPLCILATISDYGLIAETVVDGTLRNHFSSTLNQRTGVNDYV